MGLVEQRADKKAPYVLHDFNLYNPLASPADHARPAVATTATNPDVGKRTERMRELGRKGGLARASKLASTASVGPSGAATIPSEDASENPSAAATISSGHATKILAAPLAATLGPLEISGSSSLSQNSHSQTQTQTNPERATPSGPLGKVVADGARNRSASGSGGPSVAQAVAPSVGGIAWASEAEQIAGSTILDRLRSASADASLPGPLATLATIKIVRELLAHTRIEMCGYSGRLTLAGLVEVVESVASTERTRLLAPDATPKSGGDLIRYLMGAVKSQARGDVRAPRQGATKTQDGNGQPGTSREVIEADRARAARGPDPDVKPFALPMI